MATRTCPHCGVVYNDELPEPAPEPTPDVTDPNDKQPEGDAE